MFSGKTAALAAIGLLFSGRLFAAAPILLQETHVSAAESASAPEARAAETRLRVIAAAEKYRGVRYRYGGIDDQGFDCSGLVYRSFRDALAVSVPRTTGGLYAWAEKISDGEMEAGDLLFFRTTSPGTISHVGIYAGNGRFIHAASEGPQTGVIYSDLDEKYWNRTYAGAGRALPPGTGLNPQASGETAVIREVRHGGTDGAGETGGAVRTDTDARADAAGGRVRPGTALPDGGKDRDEGPFEFGTYRMGIGIAPSWNGFLKNGFPIRGAAGFIRVAAETHTWKRPVLLGLELRPEWDKTLGVFRLPVTLSLGFDERLRIFFGPSFSFGDPALRTENGERRYRGGTAWFGTAGLSAAPFSWNVKHGALALYGEFAWQSYFSDSAGKNWNADICAGLRFSTGLCFTWNL
ncbi:MAG: C40 family peptidase [Treponema sp.]|nr:C40 family peptidase [Treponema sp.]